MSNGVSPSGDRAVVNGADTVPALRASIPDAARLNRKYGKLLDLHYAYQRTVLTWHLCRRIERALDIVKARIDATLETRMAA